MNKTQKKQKGFSEKLSRDAVPLLIQCSLFALGYFLAPVPFIFDIYPFALCLLASCRSNAPFVFAGALLSVYFNMGASLPYAIALSAILALRIISSMLYVKESGGGGLNMENRKDIISSFFKENVGIRVAICSVCALGISINSVIASSFSYYEIFVLVFFVTVCALLTLALCGLYGGRDGAKSVGACALIFSLVFFLKGKEIFTLDVSIILSYASVLYASKSISPAKGAALGGLLGICQSAAFSPVFAVAALTSGFLWRFSVFLSIMCAFVLSMGYGIFASGYEAIVYLMPELLLSSLVMYPLLRFEALPRPSFVRSDSEKTTVREILSRVSADGICERLRGVSRSLKDISSLMYDYYKGEKSSTPDSRYDKCLEICEENCYSCPKRSICWERDCITTKDNIDRLSTASYYSKTVSRGDVDEKFLHRCPNIDSIIDKINEAARSEESVTLSNDKMLMSGRDYESISKIIELEAELTKDAEIEDAPLSDRLKRMADSIGFICDDIRAFGLSRKQIIATGVSIEGSKCSTELLLSQLSKVVGCPVSTPVFEGISPNAVMILSTLNIYDTDTAIFSNKTDKEEQNGDTVSVFFSASDKFYMLICDGMGTGKDASSTSKMCAEFLKKLLFSHGGKENAIAMANNFLRSKRVECSSSVDLFELDLTSGKAGFIKSGAAPSFVKRDGKVFRLFSKTAPIGIMKEPDAETLDFCLQDGDTVLMVSDGICQNEDDSKWLVDMLSAADCSDISALPKKITERSYERSPRNDDRSVAVCNIKLSPCNQQQAS